MIDVKYIVKVTRCIFVCYKISTKRLPIIEVGCLIEGLNSWCKNYVLFSKVDYILRLNYLLLQNYSNVHLNIFFLL